MNIPLIKPHMVVIIDALSRQHVMELSNCFEQLPQKPPVTLVKLTSVFPQRFYQLPEMLRAEKQVMQEAKKALCAVEQVLGFATMHHIIPLTHFTAWMRHWKQGGDTLVIGKKTVSQTKRFLKRADFFMDIDRWLAAFESLACEI